jgi:hypothetical protein
MTCIERCLLSLNTCKIFPPFSLLILFFRVQSQNNSSSTKSSFLPMSFVGYLRSLTARPLQLMLPYSVHKRFFISRLYIEFVVCLIILIILPIRITLIYATLSFFSLHVVLLDQYHGIPLLVHLPPTLLMVHVTSKELIGQPSSLTSHSSTPT